ncbi:3-isopropylmalate dehydratase small subunit [Alcaligenaceae bacterium]|nr:3-isopropylmalate dehydratase small subunit [Alcaligenaceae bacterium]
MTPFRITEGHAAALMRNNIDTDLIIRIERIAQLKRGEFAPWAFETWRYGADGKEDDAFVLNSHPFRHAPILICGANFGCGSSREMAVWALEEYGVRCILAESYGDIFFNNCLQNGLLPVTLPRQVLETLADVAGRGACLRIDLEKMLISGDEIDEIGFEFSASARQALLRGQDDISQTLEYVHQIEAFQANDRRLRPWAYPAART